MSRRIATLRFLLKYPPPHLPFRLPPPQVSSNTITSSRTAFCEPVKSAVESVGQTPSSHSHQISPSKAVHSLKVFATVEACTTLQKLEELGVEEHIVRRIAKLRRSSFNKLGEKINILLEEGVTAEQVKQLLRRLKVKCFVLATHERVASFLDFLRALNIRGQSVGIILIKNPQIIATFESKVTYLDNLPMDREKMGRLMQKYPSVFSLELEAWNQRTEYLRRIGISNKAMCRILCRFPQILGLNFELKVKPLIAYFEKCGVSRTLICAYVGLQPQIFGLSMKNLSEKMEFLQQLGFVRNSKQIIVAYLRISTVSCNLLRSRLNWLTTHGFSSDEARLMARKCPSVIVKSEGCLAKKIDYLVNVLKRDIKELVNFPSYFNYSLEKKILPRFKILAEQKEKGMFKREFALATILTCSDEVFHKRMVRNAQMVEQSVKEKSQ